MVILKLRYYLRMIDLNEEAAFAEGGNRKCYISPQDPDRCLKVLHKRLQEDLKKRVPWYKRFKADNYFDDNLREEKAYGQKALNDCNDSAVWDHLARWHGMVETNLGPASETELIRNNNEIAETLESYLFREGLTVEITQAIQTFETWLRKHLVLTKNIIPHNIVLRKENGIFILKIIDGLGCKALVPLPEYSKFFARIYVERRIKLMWSRIHWDLSGRKGNWK